MFLRVWLAIWLIFGALLCAGLAAGGFYALVRGHLSWHGQLEGLVWVPGFAALAYALMRFALRLLKTKQKERWRVAEAYALLAFGVIAYGGSIPWMTYLVVSEHPHNWWILLICVPFYTYMAWFVVKVFRAKLAAARATA
jgi:hypothetical protein